MSTHGEGDPPDTALQFHEFVHGKRAPKLAGINFSVLALGDTSYEFFCKTGADFDIQFEKLGGNRLTDRVDCDLDYEEPAEAWIETSLSNLEKLVGTQSSNGVAAFAMPAITTSLYDKKNPFQAEVLESINLNGRGSAKETLHIELSLEDSGLEYQPGDALGVYPQNNPAFVDSLLSSLELDGNEAVSLNDENLSLHKALLERLEITVLTKPVVEKYGEAFGSQAATELAQDREALKSYIYGRDIRDLIKDYPPTTVSPTALASCFRKLPARLYSIASSLDAHPDEVHLLVAIVRYHSSGMDREGVCSTFLADRLLEDQKIGVYIDRNKNFKLPEDSSLPIIMIGPGTGVAPFRAFIEHREYHGHSGKNWLFFGDQHFATDFLYQAEWLKHKKNGLLTNLDVAFSRDQQKKVYVQHRMLERKKEIYSWLQDGAHLYVCGDESRMAHDVHAALIDIIASEGSMSQENALEYVKKLQQDKRYQRDVY